MGQDIVGSKMPTFASEQTQTSTRRPHALRLLSPRGDLARVLVEQQALWKVKGAVASDACQRCTGGSMTLPRSGSRVRIPSPAPVISSMKLIGCDASQVTNKAPDSLSGGTLGGTKAVPRSLKRYSNKPSPTVLTTSPGRLYEADQPGPKRAKQVTRQQGHGPTGPPGSITA